MAAKSQSSPPQDVGLIGHCFWFVMKLIGWALLGWIVALLLTLTLLTVAGKDTGMRYLNQLINSQIHSLGHATSLTPLLTAHKVLHHVSEWVLIKTHLQEGLTAWKQGAVSHDKMLNSYAKLTYQELGIYGQAAFLSTQLIVLRLVIAFFMLPFLALTATVSFIDGLALRDVRKYSGGRESALLYHRAKRYITSSLMTGFFLFLILPVPLAAQWIFVATALVMGFSIALTTRSFKKYV